MRARQLHKRLDALEDELMDICYRIRVLRDALDEEDSEDDDDE